MLEIRGSSEDQMKRRAHSVASQVKQALKIPQGFLSLLCQSNALCYVFSCEETEFPLFLPYEHVFLMEF